MIVGVVIKMAWLWWCDVMVFVIVVWCGGTIIE